MTDPLHSLALRAEGEPFFLAALLGCYARGQHLDEDGLAATLGCSKESLVMLRLCRAPRMTPGDFWDDVTALAEHFALDPDRLAEILKRGHVLLQWQTPQAPTGSLMAARDRPPDPPGDSSEEVS